MTKGNGRAFKSVFADGIKLSVLSLGKFGKKAAAFFFGHPIKIKQYGNRSDIMYK